MISVTIPGHGLFTATPQAVERVMRIHWPSTKTELVALVTEHVSPLDYSDVGTRIELIVVLASFRDD